MEKALTMMQKPAIAILSAIALSAHADLDRAGNVLTDDDGGGYGGFDSGILIFLIGLPVLTYFAFSWLKKAKPDWSHALAFNVAFFGSGAATFLAAILVR